MRSRSIFLSGSGRLLMSLMMSAGNLSANTLLLWQLWLRRLWYWMLLALLPALLGQLLSRLYQPLRSV